METSTTSPQKLTRLLQISRGIEAHTHPWIIDLDGDDPLRITPHHVTHRVGRRIENFSGNGSRERDRVAWPLTPQGKRNLRSRQLEPCCYGSDGLAINERMVHGKEEDSLVQRRCRQRRPEAIAHLAGA